MVGHVLLGKYRISRLLDEGGMSKIYLAQQSQPQREVVVKVLKEGLRGSAKACEHFRREIHILSGRREAADADGPACGAAAARGERARGGR
jgi:hypothetical protein